MKKRRRFHAASDRGAICEGRLRVVTDNLGLPVDILRWNVKSDYPIIGVVTCSDGSERPSSFKDDGTGSDIWNLEVEEVTQLTEFECGLYDFWEKSKNLKEEDITDYITTVSGDLIRLVKVDEETSTSSPTPAPPPLKFEKGKLYECLVRTSDFKAYQVYESPEDGRIMDDKGRVYCLPPYQRSFFRPYNIIAEGEEKTAISGTADKFLVGARYVCLSSDCPDFKEGSIYECISPDTLKNDKGRSVTFLTPESMSHFRPFDGTAEEKDRSAVKDTAGDLVTSWFNRILEIARERKTLSGYTMSFNDALSEIGVLAKDAIDYISRHGLRY